MKPDYYRFRPVILGKHKSQYIFIHVYLQDQVRVKTQSVAVAIPEHSKLPEATLPVLEYKRNIVQEWIEYPGEQCDLVREQGEWI